MAEFKLVGLAKFAQRFLSTRLPRQQAAKLAANPRHSQELVARGPNRMGKTRPTLLGIPY